MQTVVVSIEGMVVHLHIGTNIGASALFKSLQNTSSWTKQECKDFSLLLCGYGGSEPFNSQPYVIRRREDDQGRQVTLTFFIGGLTHMYVINTVTKTRKARQ